MLIEGGCYCGQVRYRAEGEPTLRVQCHCRECQYITGGMPLVAMGMPAQGFSYTKGEPHEFRRADLETPVMRAFCPNCGTHVVSQPQRMAGVAVLLKVGTMDDPSQFGGPQLAIYTCDKQEFHQLPPGIPTFERTPPRPPPAA